VDRLATRRRLLTGALVKLSGIVFVLALAQLRLFRRPAEAHS